MLKIALLFSVGVLIAGALLGAAADEVRQAETQWADAVKRQDMAALSRMLADDLVYTHSTGVIDTKADYLNKMKSGAQKYEAIEHSDTNIRTYGDDTGVVNTRVRMAGATKGTPFNNQLLMTHVWIKKDGRWQLVAHQTTLLP
jgi:uncharacterized protein (TIGR02246 family)